MYKRQVHSTDGPISINSIAKRQNISDGYLEQLIGKLKKAGLVDSVRGVCGGYRLAKPPSCISVGEVLMALEGDLNPVDCAGFNEDKSCQNADTCTTKYVWKKINDNIQDVYKRQVYELAEFLRVSDYALRSGRRGVTGRKVWTAYNRRCL